MSCETKMKNGEDNPPVRNPSRNPESRVKGKIDVGCFWGSQIEITKSITPTSEQKAATDDDISNAVSGALHLE